ncbi:hypothetical protein BDA96_08G074800 [Sorghum bicolor]|uniref:Uncharacterized protein n=1 Tax=Sorghum bicolor TaxID=4558 RepID=A0A921QGD0_SORBI|nr:hypothetical protein BDA96_08G074800 [Sorghum bicolor]
MAAAAAAAAVRSIHANGLVVPWWPPPGIVRCTAALARSATFSRQSSHHPLLGLVPPLSPYLFLPDLPLLVFTEVCSSLLWMGSICTRTVRLCYRKP